MVRLVYQVNLKPMNRAQVFVIAMLAGSAPAVQRLDATLDPTIFSAPSYNFVQRAPSIPQQADMNRVAGDAFRDGTPDFLRLDSAPDQETFRSWFALIAEYQALRPPTEVPREISDCAALLRYSYRNALREHDGPWVRESGIEPPRALASIEKYRYPFTPLHALLFRVRPGAFRASDLADGTFSEFADAKTLKERNTHFLSRDVRDARPGDILFFRQLEQNSPYHSMIFVGHTQWMPDRGTENADDIVVYHTGPINGHPGEMRRLRLLELQQHPSPRWRPLPGNSNFLGVYRWNILRETN